MLEVVQVVVEEVLSEASEAAGVIDRKIRCCNVTGQ